MTKYALTEQQLNDLYTANKIVDLISEVLEIVSNMDDEEHERVFKLIVQMLEREKMRRRENG